MSTSDSSSKTIKPAARRIFLTEKPVFRIITRTIWILFFCAVIGVPLFIYSVSVDFMGLYGGLPDLSAIENPKNDLSSQLFSADGYFFGSYHRNNRREITYRDLSPNLVTTLLDSEDRRFHEHSGVDFRGLMRAIVGRLTFQPAGGGSTITMQLAENLYKTMTENQGSLYNVPGLRDIIIKTKEWIISVYLEKNFTKEEIIALYLNTIEFGSNAFGIKVASETYFNKPVDSLNLQESAVLVGMLQGITRYSPVINPDRSIAKRNEVLGKVYREGHIKSQAELDSIRALPIELNYKVLDHNEGLATYFRNVMRDYLMRWTREREIDLWESGLRIHTTIDSKLQQYAESAVAEHMKFLQKDFDEHWKGKNPWIDNDGKEIKNFLKDRIKTTPAYKSLIAQYGEGSDSVEIMLNRKKPMRIFSWDGDIDTLFSSMDSLAYYKRFLHAGMIAIDPHTGEVKAWVGGINYRYFQYDHVSQGSRQPGSTFKPFVYGAAIEEGYNPCQEFSDVSPTFTSTTQPSWTPKNFDGTTGSGDLFTLRKAMANSVNSITAKLVQLITPEKVVQFARNAGIKSRLLAVPSICLGTEDVTLLELAGAYSTFVNKGFYTEPTFISSIEDKDGNVLQTFSQKRRQAMSEQTAYKMLYMLRGGVEEEGGTSVGLSRELKINNEIGGKTGTTDNGSDGWYMMVTNSLVIGVWVGGDERSIHYSSWVSGQGSRTARPIAEKFMLKVYADETLPYKKGPFERPASGIDINLDCNRYTQSDTTIVTVDQFRPDDIR